MVYRRKKDVCEMGEILGIYAVEISGEGPIKDLTSCRKPVTAMLMQLDPGTQKFQNRECILNTD